MVRKKDAGTRALLVGTVKGAFLFEGDSARKRWKVAGPFQFGQKVNDFRCDPRDGKTLLLTATGGHLGPTVYRSTNRGKTWSEAKTPPAFGKLPKGKEKGRASGSRGFTVEANFFLAPGSARGEWYCGTSPQGLFRSRDAGATWQGLGGYNDGPQWWDWTNGGSPGSPVGGMLHSIQVDPRDPEHLYISTSSGGTFESTDGGGRFAPLNRGVAADFLPQKDPLFGHDPHCMILHPADPDRLYQQNHCGIYRLDRARGEVWERIGKNMPKAIGDIGFPIVGHPRDPDTVWVFPMDGTKLWPRTSPGGKPAVYRSRNGGRAWERLDEGLPRADAWLTVYRQAMAADDEEPGTGIYLGTTSGTLWASRDGGESFQSLAEHLPRIHSLRVTTLR